MACLNQTWYLGADMQLYWFSPLVLIPLWRWPKVGVIWLVVLIFISNLATFLVSYITQVHLIPDMLAYIKLLYYPVYVHSSPWLIGVGLGYLLHVTKGVTPDLNRGVVVAGWLISAVLIASGFILHPLINNPLTHSRLAEGLMEFSFRTLFSLGTAWVIYACAKGYGGFLNTFLSWSVFQVMGGLTYCVYIVHMPVVQWFAYTSHSITHWDYRTLGIQLIGVTAFSYAGAVVLSLVFESTFINIEKIFLTRNPNRK